MSKEIQAYETREILEELKRRDPDFMKPDPNTLTNEELWDALCPRFSNIICIWDTTGREKDTSIVDWWQWGSDPSLLGLCEYATTFFRLSIGRRHNHTLDANEAYWSRTFSDPAARANSSRTPEDEGGDGDATEIDELDKLIGMTDEELEDEIDDNDPPGPPGPPPPPKDDINEGPLTP